MESVKDVQNSVHCVLGEYNSLLSPIGRRRTIIGVCAIGEEDPDIRKSERSRALKHVNDQVSSYYTRVYGIEFVYWLIKNHLVCIREIYFHDTKLLDMFNQKSSIYGRMYR
jgi:hypothetical protein